MEGEPPALRSIAYYAYTLSVAVGLAFYLAWGIMYNSWNLLESRNIGVYSMVVIMVGFGLVGMVLYGRRPLPKA